MKLLEWIGFFGGLGLHGLLILDYVRLRRREYDEMQAAKAVSALGPGLDNRSQCAMTGCSAHQSAACADGRCRAHCRTYCFCKGNQ